MGYSKQANSGFTTLAVGFFIVSIVLSLVLMAENGCKRSGVVNWRHLLCGYRKADSTTITI